MNGCIIIIIFLLLDFIEIFKNQLNQLDPTVKKMCTFRHCYMLTIAARLWNAGTCDNYVLGRLCSLLLLIPKKWNYWNTTNNEQIKRKRKIIISDVYFLISNAVADANLVQINKISKECRKRIFQFFLCFL